MKLGPREIISRIDRKALHLAREWLDEGKIIESNGQLKAIARCFNGNFGRFTLAIPIEDLTAAEVAVKDIEDFLIGIQTPECEYWDTKTLEVGSLAKNLSANDPISSKNNTPKGNPGFNPLNERWVDL